MHMYGKNDFQKLNECVWVHWYTRRLLNSLWIYLQRGNIHKLHLKISIRSCSSTSQKAFLIQLIWEELTVGNTVHFSPLFESLFLQSLEKRDEPGNLYILFQQMLKRHWLLELKAHVHSTWSQHLALRFLHRLGAHIKGAWGGRQNDEPSAMISAPQATQLKKAPQ